MDQKLLQNSDKDYDQINQLYDECINYLKTINDKSEYEKIGKDIELEYSVDEFEDDPIYEAVNTKTVSENNINEITYIDTSEKQENIKDVEGVGQDKTKPKRLNGIPPSFKFENEKLNESVVSLPDLKSERLRRLSEQLPKIVITGTQSSNSINKEPKKFNVRRRPRIVKVENHAAHFNKHQQPLRSRGYGDFPKRLVSKAGIENVALISNVPFGKIRLLNDTFHTLINLRWRWIVVGTIVVHFAIWLVFAVFWYITALAHYDFEPDPPQRACVTGGKDFVTIFLASVEAQTTIGFGDRAIDEECPESIFLFIMQLILGTGLSGVLTCVVYAKLTRPEKLSRDGVGFSKKAVVSMRDGRLCLMMRAWDLNYDHIISSEFSAHFINTYRTKEGELIRFFARSLPLQTRQFLLWPVTLVHVIDHNSPLYQFTPDLMNNNSFEITVSLKGASASMGTFTQSQCSYKPREVAWGYRFPPVVKYDQRKRKYVISHQKLDLIEPVDTPYCSAAELAEKTPPHQHQSTNSSSPSQFGARLHSFYLGRSSSFKRKEKT